MKFFLIQIFFVLLGTSAVAETKLSDFASCKATDAPRNELDHFCPRIEGIHLEGCCPPVFKPAIPCTYAVLVENGQAYLANSAYSVCQGADADGYGGQEIAINCCRNQQKNCYKDKVDTNFIPRLINRSKKCCVETCPAATYWMEPPAKPGITSQHKLISGPNICTGVQDTTTCDYGSVENCQASIPCQQRPSPPGTSPPGTTPLPTAPPGTLPPQPTDTSPPGTLAPPPTVKPITPGGM